MKSVKLLKKEFFEFSLKLLRRRLKDVFKITYIDILETTQGRLKNL